MACCQEQACNAQIRRQTDRRFRKPIGLIPTRPVYSLSSLFFSVDVVAAAAAVVGLFFPSIHGSEVQPPQCRPVGRGPVVVVVVTGGASAAVGPDGRAGASHGGVRAPGLS